MSDAFEAARGVCSCGQVCFQFNRPPLFVHCCHCTCCQRESGSAFAVNAMIETSAVQLLEGELEAVLVPSASGRGQKIVRCPKCKVALWSHYSGAGDALSFIRVGSLKEAWRFAPDIHIYTESKLPWVLLPEGVPAVPQFYRASQMWPAESIERRAKLMDTKA